MWRKRQEAEDYKADLIRHSVMVAERECVMRYQSGWVGVSSMSDKDLSGSDSVLLSGEM